MDSNGARMANLPNGLLSATGTSGCWRKAASIFREEGGQSLVAFGLAIFIRLLDRLIDHRDDTVIHDREDTVPHVDPRFYWRFEFGIALLENRRLEGRDVFFRRGLGGLPVTLGFHIKSTSVGRTSGWWWWRDRRFQSPAVFAAGGVAVHEVALPRRRAPCSASGEVPLLGRRAGALRPWSSSPGLLGCLAASALP